ncbi:MAG: malectin domain-containing carbohydrate-binding protein, partial [Planctomycetota bacterium]|nr:malectin domain-containing carbohydrate-binding protein [Planctomycetota bacterium]
RKGDEGKFSVIETFPGRKDSDSYFDNKIERGRSYQYLLHVRNRDGKVTPYGEPLTVTPLTWVRRINCGGPDVTTPDGRVWEADKTRISGSGIWTSRSSIQKAAVLQEIYKSERWAKTSLTYTFDAKPGRYRIILHLAETNRSFSVRGKRVYEVRWNDRKIAGPVDVFRASGKSTAWQLEKTVDLKTTQGKLVLKRIRGIGPAVKGIEVMSNE